jgi:hypothetical protein
VSTWMILFLISRKKKKIIIDIVHFLNVENIH